MSRDIFHQPRVLRAASSLALSTAREGAATASLGSLGQCFTTLMVKNFFPISNLNLPSFSLEPFALSYHCTPLCKAPLHPSCRPLQALAAALRSPQSLLFSRLNSPNSLSLSSEERCSSPWIIFVASSGPVPTHPCPSYVGGSRAGRRTPGGV